MEKTSIYSSTKVHNERKNIESGNGEQGGNLRVEKREFELNEVTGLLQS